MRLFRLPSSYHGEEELTLEGKDAHYVTGVLRLKEGTHLLAQDAHGVRYQGLIVVITSSTCTIKLTVASKDVIATDTLPAYEGNFTPLVLLQCLLKGKKEEQVVRQATELGVSEIALIASDHCTVQLGKKDVTARFDRLNGQVKEALQQSGSPIPTALHPSVLSLKDLPSWWNGRGPLLFLHQSERQASKDLSFYAHDVDPTAPVGLLIGPEGGFSQRECDLLEEAGFLPILLKTNILRSETAAIYALSSLQELIHQ